LLQLWLLDLEPVKISFVHIHLVAAAITAGLIVLKLDCLRANFLKVAVEGGEVVIADLEPRAHHCPKHGGVRRLIHRLYLLVY
jgi:hypothetical protein